MLKKYCGDVTIWTYPLPPMSPLVIIWRPLWTTPKRGFLEISQNSQENTSARVSFSIKESLNNPGSLF